MLQCGVASLSTECDSISSRGAGTNVGRWGDRVVPVDLVSAAVEGRVQGLEGRTWQGQAPVCLLSSTDPT